MVSNPLWPAAGKMPSDKNNFAPRVGIAYSIGSERPLMVRGGFGIFYTRIPQIYESAVINNNGVNEHFFSWITRTTTSTRCFRRIRMRW